MIGKVLIANRGEIALRIHRACKDMGIATVAVHSEADGDAMHVRLADESVCIGPASALRSYLNIPAIISAAEITGADAVHPGYGFLSESARFARIVSAHGMIFIGPKPEHIETMGDKIAAKTTMRQAGMKVIAGSGGAIADPDELRRLTEEIGYPVLIKAAGGGGGRGMRIVRSAAELDSAFHAARNEARTAFDDDAVYLEKFLDKPRHIEIQLLADAHGAAVHLGERDCSLQRGQQKILEEAPGPALNRADADRIGALARDAALSIGYLGAGTMEFLYADGEFYFMEMNTRLQVEHPVTEMITGLDLVREQILVAAGEKLSFGQSEVSFTGHAIECRINAEHPFDFTPAPGMIRKFHAPGGPGVRLDSAIYSGYDVPPHYDSLIGKLIVYAMTRDECLMRLRRALDEMIIEGASTNLALHRKLVDAPQFVSGDYDTSWLERWVEEQGLKR